MTGSQTTNDGGSIRVAVVDDIPAIREGVRSLLAHETDLAVVVAVSTVEELLAHPQSPVDVVLLDQDLSGHGDEMGDVQRSVPRVVRTGARVLIFTQYQRPATIREAQRLGALGLVLKRDPAATIADGIRTVATGERYVSSDLAYELLHDTELMASLTQRHCEVLQAVAEGLTASSAGRRLGITERTVRKHLGEVFERYATVDRRRPRDATAAYRNAVADGHMPLPSAQERRSASRWWLHGRR